MPAKKKKEIPKKAVVSIVALVVVLISVAVGGSASFQDVWKAADEVLFGNPSQEVSQGDVTPPSITGEGDELMVMVQDVGQGDSIFIRTPTKNILIDASLGEFGETIVDNLKAQGVEKLDYVIATHPHADHIGGMDAVLQSFPVDTIVMSPQPHTTKMYERLLDTLEEKNITTVIAEPSMVLDMGDGTILTFFGPVEEFKDLNDASIITRLDFGETSFLFSGDAEETAETATLATNPNLDVDMMTAGHHGSRTSSSKAYFEAASPEFVAISCGIDNEYGHPHKESMQRFEAGNCIINRTDLEGDLFYTSDGIEIQVKTAK